MEEAEREDGKLALHRNRVAGFLDQLAKSSWPPAVKFAPANRSQHRVKQAIEKVLLSVCPQSHVIEGNYSLYSNPTDHRGRILLRGHLC